MCVKACNENLTYVSGGSDIKEGMLSNIPLYTPAGHHSIPSHVDGGGKKRVRSIYAYLPTYLPTYLQT